MIGNLVRSEFIKFRSVRSTVVTLLIGGALVVAIALLIINEDRYDDLHYADLLAGISFATLLFGALGVQAIGQEHRFATIRVTFAAAPHRTKVLLAKLAVVVGCTVAITAAMQGVCYLLGATLAPDFVFEGVDQRAVFGTLLFSAGFTALGFGVGAIVRQPIAGIMILLGWGFVAEPLLRAQVSASRPWLPVLNGLQMTQVDGDSLLRSVFSGGVLFLAITALVVAIGVVLTNRRDA